MSKKLFTKKQEELIYAISYMIDEFASSRTDWVESHFRKNEVTYFDTFGVEYIPKEINKFIGNKVIKASILKIQVF